MVLVIPFALAKRAAAYNTTRHAKRAARSTTGDADGIVEGHSARATTCDVEGGVEGLVGGDAASDTPSDAEGDVGSNDSRTASDVAEGIQELEYQRDERQHKQKRPSRRAMQQ